MRVQPGFCFCVVLELIMVGSVVSMHFFTTFSVLNFGMMLMSF